MQGCPRAMWPWRPPAVAASRRPSASLWGPPHHGSGSCQMIGPHAINSSPVPTAKTTPCSSEDRGGRRRGPAQGQIVRHGLGRKGKARLCGASTLGTGGQAQTLLTAGTQESPFCPSPGSFPLGNLPIELHQNCRAGRAQRDQLAHLLASSSRIDGIEATRKVVPFSKTPCSKEAEPALP